MYLIQLQSNVLAAPWRFESGIFAASVTSLHFTLAFFAPQWQK